MSQSLCHSGRPPLSDCAPKPFEHLLTFDIVIARARATAAKKSAPKKVAKKVAPKKVSKKVTKKVAPKKVAKKAVKKTAAKKSRK